MLARSIEDALETAGAEEDLQTILQVLEDESVGFKRHEAAAGPFANMETVLLADLDIRVLTVIKKPQQQQQQQHPGWPLSTKYRMTLSVLCTCKEHPPHLALTSTESLQTVSLFHGPRPLSNCAWHCSS